MNERFWSKVAKSDGCWLWTAYKKPNGYGGFRRNGVMQYAHRVSYELEHGPIPDGMFVCHTCDVRACVNPAHLFLGTCAENLADMRAKGRHRHGETHHGFAKPECMPRGDAHPAHKLTTASATNVLILLSLGAVQRDCVRWFGVERGAISDLSIGKTWAHLRTTSRLAGGLASAGRRRAPAGAPAAPAPATSASAAHCQTSAA